MWTLAWSQLRFRTVRLVALLAGMLLATTAFTVLTAASRTAQLRTVGTVSAHFVPAYDILVRPKGARTALEAQTGTVQPNFLSGIYGGITMAQYDQIASIPGVQVAAPIAMVGYTLLVSQLSFPLPAADLSRPGRQLYRVTTTWISQGGASRATEPPSFAYVTPQRLGVDAQTGYLATERLPDGTSVTICPADATLEPGVDPFGVAAQSDCTAWSKANGYGPAGPLVPGVSPADPGYDVDWVIPVLIAAVDPVAEAKLDGLNRAVISGHYLAEHVGGANSSTFPVLASSVSGLDESAVTQLATLSAPVSPPSVTASWITQHGTAPGQVISAVTTTARQAYQQLLAALAVKPGPAAPNVGGGGTVMYAGKMEPSNGGRVGIHAYWSVGPTSYRQSRSGTLVARLTHNPPSTWYTGGAQTASMDDEDNQYRKVSVHAPAGTTFTSIPASPQLVGIFNPAKINEFDPLSRIPLGAYEPVVAVPANPAANRALHGSDLLPNQNLGGYVSQPVDLVTTLSALPALQNQGYYGTNLPLRDPISVVRVRVAGVTGPNPVSLERIREAAQQIEVRTGLDVDIVAGSSPSPTTIDLPAGKFGQPPLTLSEDWVKKGVAVAILSAIDKNSLVLFLLILVVCVLFVANSASAAIRSRRRELGVLACLGWTKPRLFTAVLGEVAAIGLAAGLLGAAAALPLSSAVGLHASPGRAALAVPVAVAVAVIAGLIPAWLAARAGPAASVRPPVLGVRRARQPGGITALAAVNVLRTPGRAAVGAVSLAVGVTALTMLSAVTFAFRGVVVGSLLGNAVAVQVRGVDYVAVTATVALGVLAVADVVFLNIRERAPELAAFRAFGWRETALSRLVITEGAIIGLAGSLAGAALGLAAAAEFAGQLPATLYLIAAAAVAGGLLVTTTAALLPAQALRRLPAAHLLAEE
jgi:putative ABC transport system permease protein